MSWPGMMSHIGLPDEQARVRVSEVTERLSREVGWLVTAQLLERFADGYAGFQFSIEIDSELHGLGVVDFLVRGDDAAPSVAQTVGGESAGLAESLRSAPDTAGVEIKDRM